MRLIDLINEVNGSFVKTADNNVMAATLRQHGVPDALIPFFLENTDITRSLNVAAATNDLSQFNTIIKNYTPQANRLLLASDAANEARNYMNEQVPGYRFDDNFVNNYLNGSPEEQGVMLQKAKDYMGPIYKNKAILETAYPGVPITYDQARNSINDPKSVDDELLKQYNIMNEENVRRINILAGHNVLNPNYYNNTDWFGGGLIRPNKDGLRSYLKPLLDTKLTPEEREAGLNTIAKKLLPLVQQNEAYIKYRDSIPKNLRSAAPTYDEFLKIPQEEREQALNSIKNPANYFSSVAAEPSIDISNIQYSDPYDSVPLSRPSRTVYDVYKPNATGEDWIKYTLPERRMDDTLRKMILDNFDPKASVEDKEYAFDNFKNSNFWNEKGQWQAGPQDIGLLMDPRKRFIDEISELYPDDSASYALINNPVVARALIDNKDTLEPMLKGQAGSDGKYQGFQYAAEQTDELISDYLASLYKTGKYPDLQQVLNAYQSDDPKSLNSLPPVSGMYVPGQQAATNPNQPAATNPNQPAAKNLNQPATATQTTDPNVQQENKYKSWLPWLLGAGLLGGGALGSGKGITGLLGGTALGGLGSYALYKLLGSGALNSWVDKGTELKNKLFSPDQTTAPAPAPEKAPAKPEAPAPAKPEAPAPAKPEAPAPAKPASPAAPTSPAPVSQTVDSQITANKLKLPSRFNLDRMNV